MRRPANDLLHSIKDQIRVVRFSIKAEAEIPGSALPDMLPGLNLGPLVTIGSVVGKPAFRLADTIFTQVESIATKILPAPAGNASAFPCHVRDYFAPDEAGSVSFSGRLYGPLKDMLQRQGVRRMVVSEQALDRAWDQIRARHADSFSSGNAGGTDDAVKALVQVCAGIACGLADAKPIRRVEFGGSRQVRQHFVLSPNLYCSMTVGLATAMLTLNPHLIDDREAVIESAESAVDARFGRFKRALSGKEPIGELSREFQAILAFLP